MHVSTLNYENGAALITYDSSEPAIAPCLRASWRRLGSELLPWISFGGQRAGLLLKGLARRRAARMFVKLAEMQPVAQQDDTI